MSTSPAQDRDLVLLARDGCQTAFEQIVERYQSLMCSITYSGTGDLALSEDLAQEAFLTAWQSLPRLRDPEKLRSWLCGIARRIVANRRRVESRMPSTVALDATSIDSTASDPSETAIGNEEKALVWQTLNQIPQKYREPLVLFYREDHSIRQVAENLELSEATVKQRLSRGRLMLSERLVALVESTLTQSKPGKAFSTAVIAALPAIAPQAVSAAVITTSGKGAAASKSAAFSGALGAVFGPILGILGGAFAVAFASRQARSCNERRLVVRVGWLVFGYIALLNLFIAVAYALVEIMPRALAVMLLALLSVAYVGGLIGLGVWVRNRRQQIRKETGTAISASHELAQMNNRKMATGLAGSIFGSVYWILFMSLACDDWLTAILIGVVSLVVFTAGYSAVHRSKAWFYRVCIAIVGVLGALNLVVVNLRWVSWVKQLIGDVASSQLIPTLWALNLLLVGIFALIMTSLVLTELEFRAESKRETS